MHPTQKDEMAEPYKDERARQERKSSVAGIILTVAVHICIIAVGTVSGLKYLYEAPEAVNDDFGDVETPQPPRKKEIDRRALFHAADNKTRKDTLAAQTAARVSDALKAGHAQGNTKTGNTEGTPNAHLAGRQVLGALPMPSYTVQQAGKVVVTIKVDQYGKVLEAVPGAQGTTVTDKTIWEAAKKAALESRFNMSSDAPIVQEGTITYVFHLTKD